MVKIAFPNPNDYGNNVKGFLRQLELSVHHAQKSYEQLVEDKQILPDDEIILVYRFPKEDLYSKERDDDGFVKVHLDEEGDEFQSIELEIGTV